MSINIEKMRERLEALKNPKQRQNNKKDFLKIEENTTAQVRLIPPKDGDPFKSFFFHYSITPGGALCPKANFGEPCPVCDFVGKLFNDKTEDSVKMAKDLMRKQRFFSQVLVRGKEVEGVKLWSYSKTVYEDLLKAFVDPDIGDITDPNEGYDIEVESKKTPPKKFVDTKIDVKRKSSALLPKGSDLNIEKLLSSAPDPSSIFKPVSGEELVKMLEDFLNPVKEQTPELPPKEGQSGEDVEDVSAAEPEHKVVDKPVEKSTKRSKVDEALAAMRS